MKRLRKALLGGRAMMEAERRARAAEGPQPPPPTSPPKKKRQLIHYNGQDISPLPKGVFDLEKLRLLTDATMANVDQALFELRNELRRLNGHVLPDVDHPVGLVDWREIYGRASPRIKLDFSSSSSSEEEESFSDSLET